MGAVVLPKVWMLTLMYKVLVTNTNNIIQPNVAAASSKATHTKSIVQNFKQGPMQHLFSHLCVRGLSTVSSWESKLPADHSCLGYCPMIITDGPPLVVIVDLHSSLTISGPCMGKCTYNLSKLLYEQSEHKL